MLGTLGLIALVSAPAMAGPSPSANAGMASGTQARMQVAANDTAPAHPRTNKRAVNELLHQYANGWLWSLGRR